MAPSSNYTLIALLVVAFAGIILHPTAASRIRGGLDMAIAANTDRASAPSQDNGDLLPPQPRECRPWLERMMPCASFLTNTSVYAPEPTCCDGFNAMFTLDTVTCLCHVVNGDIDQLLPAPMHHMRMEELFSVCGHDVPVDLFAASDD